MKDQTKKMSWSEVYLATFILYRTIILQYSSVEQGFQHIKALLFGDKATAADILASNDPAVPKRLSYNISGFNRDVWTTKRHDIMLEIVKAKFHQNLELADELRATGKKTIAESGKHQFFANGLAITNNVILDMSQWNISSRH